MQHDPDSIRFVEADLDEVVPAAQGPELFHRLAVGDPRVSVQNRFVTRGKPLPGPRHGLGGTLPAPYTLSLPNAVGNRALDVTAKLAEGIRKIRREQAGALRHHAATDIHADGGRDDRADRGNDTPDCGADAKVDVGHGRHPRLDKGELGDLMQLLFRCGLERHS